MSEGVLVDSDVLIDHLRGHASMSERRITTWSYSVIARAELFGGADDADTIRSLLGVGEELEVTTEIAECAGRIKRACRIALPDALIAATALVHGRVLVTRNVKDFERIPLLRVTSPSSTEAVGMQLDVGSV